MTEYRPIPGYEGHYEVSDGGEVRAVARTIPVHLSNNRVVGRRLPGGLLRLHNNTHGYLAVKLHLAGRQTTYSVHKLVAMAFLGHPAPEGRPHVRHLDGDQLNNTVQNLAYSTVSDNNFDVVRHGRHHQAIKTHCPAGHPYDLANTYVHRSGRRTARMCRACNRAAVVRSKARRLARQGGQR